MRLLRSILGQSISHYCFFPVSKFLKKNNLKNDSELTLQSDYAELYSWTVAFKTILTH